MDKIQEILKSIEKDIADLKIMLDEVQSERNYDHFKDEQI